MLRVSILVFALVAAPAWAQSSAAPTASTAISGYNPNATSISNNGQMGYGAASGYGATSGYDASSTAAGTSSVRGQIYRGAINPKTGRYIAGASDAPTTSASRALMNSYSTNQNSGIDNGGAIYDPH